MAERNSDLDPVEDLPNSLGYLETSRYNPETGERKSYKVPLSVALVVPATTTAKGIARLSTDEEAEDWTPSGALITPKNLGAAISYMLQNRVVAGEGIELNYADGVLDISRTGGGGLSGVISIYPNSSYYYEGFPIPGPYGDAWAAGDIPGGLTPFNTGGGGDYAAPVDFPDTGMGFVYDPSTNEVWFVFTFDGSTGTETVLLEGVPDHPTLHSDDATYAVNSVYGLGIFSWLVGTDGPPVAWLADYTDVTVTIS